jgi:hypothetical protein
MIRGVDRVLQHLLDRQRPFRQPSGKRLAAVASEKNVRIAEICSHGMITQNVLYRGQKNRLPVSSESIQ